MTFRVVFTLSLFCTFFNATHSQDSTENQLLWRIEHPDFEHVSYLYGTMHVRDHRAFQLSDSVLAALHRSDVYAMEVHPDDLIDRLFNNPTSFHYQKISRALPKEDYEKLNDRFQTELNINLDEYYTNQLSLLDDLISDAQPDSLDYPTALDAWFYELAKGWGKKVVGLEDIDRHMEAGEGEEGISEEELSEYLLWRLENQYAPSYLDKLKDVYSRGDLEAIEAWSEQNFEADSSGKIKNFDLTKRNYIQADSIIGLHKRGSVFAAVGAAHLPGDQGVVALLKDKGCALSVVKASFTGQKEKYEALPRKKKKMRLIDNRKAGYRASMPTKAFKRSRGRLFGKSSELYIGQDMGSGISYGIVSSSKSTSKNPNIIFDKVAKNYIKRADDFENAVVIDSGTVTVDGLSGRRLSFSVRKGAEQEFLRMNMFYSDEMLYVLFGGGTNVDLNHPDLNAFFNSFALRPIRIPKLEMFTDNKLAFECMLPSISEYTSKLESITDSDGDFAGFARVELYQTKNKEEKTEYACGVFNYPTDYNIYNDSLLLKELVAGIKKKFKPKEVLLDSTYSFEGYPCLEYHFTYGLRRKKCHIRYVFRGARMYMLITSEPVDMESKGWADQIFDSFTLLPIKQKNPKDWQVYKDPSMNFRVSFPNKPVISDDRDEEVKEANRSLWVDYTYEHLSSYTSMDSGSSFTYGLVGIQYTDYVTLLGEDTVRNIWRDHFEAFVDSNAITYDSTVTVIDGGEARDYWIKPEHSINHIRYRIVTKGKTMFIQYVTASEQFILKAPVLHFFQSLDLSKVSSEGNPYEDKPLVILKGLSNSDTLQQAFARRAFTAYEWTGEDSTALLEAFKQEYDVPFEDQEDTHIMLSEALAESGSQQAIPLIVERYKSYVDKDKLQASLLSDLAILGSDEAFDQAFKLLYSQPPKEHTWNISSMLRIAIDSGKTTEVKDLSLHLLETVDWWPKTMFLFKRLADSGYVVFDSIPKIKTHILSTYQESKDSIGIFLKQYKSDPDDYISWYKAVDGISNLRYLAYDHTRIKELKKLEKRVIDKSIYLNSEIVETLLHYQAEPLQASIDSMADKDYWQIDLVKMLTKYDRMDLFPTRLSQTDIARSYAINIADEGVPVKSTLLEKRPYTYEGKKGFVYCFHFHWGGEDYDEDYDYVVLAGLFDGDTSVLCPLDDLGDYTWVDDIEEFSLDEFWEKFTEY